MNYKERWRNTWLPGSKLGNAQRLLQEFEAHKAERTVAANPLAQTKLDDRWSLFSEESHTRCSFYHRIASGMPSIV